MRLFMGLIVAAAMAAACSDSGDDAPATATIEQPPSATAPPPASPTPRLDDSQAALVAADRFVLLLQQHNREGIQQLAAEALRPRLAGGEMERLLACVPAGSRLTFAGRNVELLGQTTAVRAQLNLLRPDGSASTGDMRLEFTRDAAGAWLLSSLPACPFR